MAEKITDKTYLAIQGKVKTLLVTALKIKAISSEELMAILYILGQTSTTLELETFLDIFKDTFPVLGQYSEGERESAKVDLEERVKTAVSRLVHKDPLKATEIAKAALKPGVTWEEIIKDFPELEQ